MRNGVVAIAAVVVAVVACASTQELSNDAPALDGIHGDASPFTAGGGTSSGEDGSGGATDSTSSGGASATSSGGSSESSGGHATASHDAGGGGRGQHSGGATAAGGTRSSSSGNADAGDAPDGSACPADQKRCDSQCRVPSPAIGCDPAGPCTACGAAPTNGFSKCTGNACDFDCLSGFRRNAAGNGCESDTGAGGTGNGSGGRTGRGGRTGSGGTTSSGGSTASCNARDCPDCNSLLEAPCCHRDGTCGCGLLGVLCGN